MVWDGAHSVYLAGAVDRAAGWRDLIEREIVPAGNGILKAYVTDAAAGTVFAGYPLRRRERVLYRGGGPAAPDRPRLRPVGFHVSSVNDRFAELAALGNAADVIAEIRSGWRSVDDFRDGGFGFAAHDARTIVCWCTAEYVSDGRCGIGIETVAAYRGRGFATLTASAFVHHCAERGMTPHWDAWTGNLPSVAVAERVGLRKVETYPIYVGDFADLRP
jgi:GNAT superfamily N-acetyltransferase